MVSDSFTQFQEHLVFLCGAELLIRTNVKVIPRDALRRVIQLFALFLTRFGIVNEIIVHITHADAGFDFVYRFLSFGGKKPENRQCVLICSRIGKRQQESTWSFLCSDFESLSLVCLQ